MAHLEWVDGDTRIPVPPHMLKQAWIQWCNADTGAQLTEFVRAVAEVEQADHNPTPDHLRHWGPDAYCENHGDYCNR